MDNASLEKLFNSLSDQVQGQKGHWQFVINDLNLVCITDELHNRMRIISPIKKVENLTNEQLKRCLEANFHTALDTKYAITNDIVWSVFLHPLRELTADQVVDAVKQIYSCVHSFGTQYSSGSLYFPTDEDKRIKDN